MQPECRKNSPACFGRATSFRAVLLASALSLSATAVWAQSGPSDASSAQPTAGAQTPPDAKSGAPATAASNANASTVSEVVITALKHSSLLQRTPISITAVTGDALKNNGITDINSFAKTVPSLSLVDNGPGNEQIVIRGIVASAGEPTVGLYYDETPVPGLPGASNNSAQSTPELRLFDVERVETLRGPQGTLYGSGSMGGTLRVIFAKPKDDVESAVDGTAYATAGGDPGYQVNGMVNVPIVSGKLDARVVGYYQDDGGYIDNAYLHLNDVNRNLSYGGRFLLRATPVERLTLDFAAFFQRTNSASYSWDEQAGRDISTYRVQLPVQDQISLYSLTGHYDAGAVTFTAIGSYFQRHLISSGDQTYLLGTTLNTASNCEHLGYSSSKTTPCDPAQFTTFENHVHSVIPSELHPDQHETDYNGEIRASSNWEGPLHATVGLYAEDRKVDINNPLALASPTTGALYNPLQDAYLRQIFDDLKQEAVFGEVSYDILHNLTATFGGRYFHYSRDTAGQTPIPLDLVGAVLTPYTLERSGESGEVYKFNLSYQYTRQILFYGQASQGFRPGGVNQTLGLPTALTPYQSDSLWDYEVGTKTSWFGNRLVVDADVFRIDWSDIQVSGQTPNGAFSFISNAGAARIQGVEAESTVIPVAGLRLQATFDVLSAKLTENQVNSELLAPGRAGDRLPFVPEFSGDLSAQYSRPLTDAFNGVVRGDVDYVGSSFSQISPTSVNQSTIPATSLLNLRAGVENSKWGVYIFCNNVLDRTDIITTGRSSSEPYTTAISGRPRTIGINFRDKF